MGRFQPFKRICDGSGRLHIKDRVQRLRELQRGVILGIQALQNPQIDLHRGVDFAEVGSSPTNIML